MRVTIREYTEAEQSRGKPLFRLKMYVNKHVNMAKILSNTKEIIIQTECNRNDVNVITTTM